MSKLNDEQRGYRGGPAGCIADAIMLRLNPNCDVDECQDALNDLAMNFDHCLDSADFYFWGEEADEFRKDSADAEIYRILQISDSQHFSFFSFDMISKDELKNEFKFALQAPIEEVLEKLAVRLKRSK